MSLQRTSTSTTYAMPGHGRNGSLSQSQLEKGAPAHTVTNSPGMSGYRKHLHWQPVEVVGAFYLVADFHLTPHFADESTDLNNFMTDSPHLRKLADTTPFGFCSLAIAIFTTSLVHFHARGTYNFIWIAAPAIWVGGLGQLLAGMFAVARNDVLSATGFTGYASSAGLSFEDQSRLIPPPLPSSLLRTPRRYGLFWIAYGFQYAANLGSSYSANPAEMNYILGFFNIAYWIFSFIMILGSLRKSVAHVVVFTCLGLNLLLIGVAQFYPGRCETAGAVFGFLCAVAAFYTAAATLLTEELSRVKLPLGDLSGKSED